jgi:hypothetical protein
MAAMLGGVVEVEYQHGRRHQASQKLEIFAHNIYVHT